ncbi:MAG: hypothetical protein CL607_21570 [Anaerolineaceae bacterium]|nr:hypothetical protein [Anaerolineaceae bacterium]MCA9885393.1 hypothetical protein [Anaerolineae bacterium]MCA9889544.1 hypothetical protein [Anaerolineae bacterium]MCA9891448.1 hypothetical protein [Anaerolineae bacterium]
MIDLNGQPLRVLTEILNNLAPVELEGMRLLAQLRPDSPRLLPSVIGIDRDTLRRATSEIIDYTGRCQRMRSRMIALNPVPLTGLTLPEFGL